MTAKQMVDYWAKASTEDLLTAEVLFKAKRYLPCLFFCHLSLEKILKAIFIAKKDEAAPFVHDLVKLSRLAAIKLTKKTEEDLREISRFNVQARYNDYKFSMYKKATKKFTQVYLKKTREIYQWLKEKT